MIFSKAISSNSRAGADNKKSDIKQDEFSFSPRLGGGSDYTIPEKVIFKELTFDTMYQMYLANVWVRACVDKITRRAASIEPVLKSFLRNPVDEPSKQQLKRIETVENLIAVPNNGSVSFSSILQQVFNNILIWDAGCVEIVNNNNQVVSIFPVSGDSIRKNVDQRGVFRSPDAAYIQKDTGGKVVANFAIDEMFYMMQYPMPGRVYGLSPLESLRQTVTADLYANDFNIQRFKNDATPKIAILFENLGIGQGQPALERLRQWWKNELEGKPHKPILLGSENGSIKFEHFGYSNEDMQFQEFQRWLLSKIMAVYHMQAAVLGIIEINQGRINAAYQEEQFKKDAIIPLLMSFSNAFNTCVLWNQKNYNYNNIYLDWEGLDNVDKQLKAKIHEIYLRQGVYTINMVLRELGMNSVPWGDVPYLLNQMVPFGGQPIPETTVPIKGNGDIDLNKWLSMGLNIGGVIPTGLEIVEKSDLKSALTKLNGVRDAFLSKHYSIPKQLVS